MRKGIKGCLLGTILMSSSLVWADTAQQYDDALTAFNEGEIQSSYLLLKQVLKDNSDHLPSKLLMGRILLLDGYIGEAIDELEEVLLAGGDVNLVMPPLSRAYLFAGKYNKIFAILNRNELNDEARLSVTLVAGTAHGRLNERDKAVALYNRTLKEFPDSVALLNAQTTLLTELGRVDEAERLLDKALAINPDGIFTLLAKGKLVDAKEESALPIYARAMKLAPDNPAVMRAYAGALAEDGQYEKASSIVDDIEKQTPGDVQNQLLKARILALTKNQLEADKILKALTERLSLLTDEQLNEQIELSLITGIVAYLNNNYDLASTELTRYIGKRDATPEQIGMLADALLKTGGYKDAAKMLEKHEYLVVENLTLARLNCELFMALKKSFKCEQMMPELEKRYAGEPQLAILRTKVLLNKRQFAEAAAILNGPLATSDEAEVMGLKVALHSDQHDYDTALPLARQLLAKQPDSLGHQAIVADLLIRTNRLEEATGIVDGILSKEPENIAGLVARARIAFFENDYARSRKAIDDAIKLDKTSVAAQILAAQIYLADDRQETAIEHLVSAKTLDKSNILARELLVSVYREQGDNKAALAEINALLGIERLSARYHMEKASVLNEMKDAQGTKTELDMVYALWSEQPQKLLSLARFQADSGDAEGADRSYRTAIEKAADEQIGYLEYASFLIGHTQFEQASTVIATVNNQFGLSPDLLRIKGDYARATGQPEAAFDHYLNALHMDSSYTLPLVNAFELAKRGVKRDTLISYLTAQTQTDNSPVFKKHLLADLYYTAGSFEQAEPLYQELLKAEKLTNRAFVLNNLANIYAGTDNTKALKMAEQALALMPKSAALLDTKGWIIALQEDYLTGLGVLRQAYTIDSSDPSVHYHIAFALYKLGRHDEARQMLTEHNTLERSFREKEDAQALLDKL